MEIRLLGGAWAQRRGGEPVALERKRAALLAYLALEGPTARQRLLGLLWPDSPEPTALNNLRQLRRRLRTLLGRECVKGGEQLQLLPAVAMDVLQLRAGSEAEDDTRVASFPGELLGDLHYEADGCAELQEWLQGWRWRLKRARFEALDREVRRLEREGNLAAAVSMSWRMLELDPQAELAYQHLIRLRYLQGNRSAAMETYRRCVEMLRRDLEVGPSEATRQLVVNIQQHEAARRVPSPPPLPEVPLRVVSPPVLAGREREWAAMEQAWALRRPMLLEGEAGIGKSRLMMDFAQTRGPWVVISARLGDKDLPYATHRRNLHALLSQSPGVEMKPWVRRELSRLLPDLETRALPLPRSPEEKVRLFAAARAFMREAFKGIEVLVFDDAQYMDLQSAELGVYLHSEFMEEMAAGRMPVFLNAYRPHEEAQPEIRELMENFALSGMVTQVPVSRLNRQAVREMLRGMGEPALEGISNELADYTGGNPLFIVETARHLLQSGTFDGSFPSSLPPPGRIGIIIEHRIRLLPEEALRLAYVLAVARSGFSLERASLVLGQPTERLAVLWKQLEQAQILRGTWFSHDLVLEALKAALPAPVRKSLEGLLSEHSHPP